jgi:beta-glucanase (GH16 family)
MVLSIRKDPDNPGKYLTGHVGSTKTFNGYGYFEANVKFPAVFGALNGWWLAPRFDYAPDDPSTPENERNVEIDIAECGGRSVIQHTVWYRDPGQLAGQFHKPPPHISTDLPKDAQAQYHRYGVLWEPTGYTFYIDRKAVGTVTGGLSSGAVFPILSIKMPLYLLDDFDVDRITEYKMRTKWIRVWQ